MNILDSKLISALCLRAQVPFSLSLECSFNELMQNLANYS